MAIEFPHDLDAERALLGALLLHPERFVEVADELDVADFYRHAHRLTFEAMHRVFSRRQSGDFVAVRAELERAGQLDEVGGPAYLSSLSDGVPRSSLEPAVAVVRDRSLRRQLIQAAQEMLAEASTAETGALALEQAEGAIYTMAARLVGGSELIDSARMATEVMDVIERLQTTGRVAGVETGLAELDNLTRGFHANQLVILAARPGKGKSALALNVAEHVASTYEGDVPFFSLEMAADEIGVRRVAIRARISNHKILSGIMKQEDYGRLTHATGLIRESRMIVDDSADRTVSQIRSVCRRIKAQRGVSMVVVDYLQLLTPPRNAARGTSREQHVASFGRGLKLLAKELRVPVVALSQLSRSSEERKNQRPQLSDLRESGSLEQDADMVIFVHPPNVANGTAQLIVAKQRNGPKGTVAVAYEPSMFWFGNLAKDDPRGAAADDDGGGE